MASKAKPPADLADVPEVFRFTTAELAQVYGCDPSTLKDWRAKGMPTAGRLGRSQGYDVRAVVQWRRAEDLKDDPQRLVPASIVRRNDAAAEKAEFELAIKRGEYLDTRAALEQWRTVLARLRARLLQLPPSVAPLLAQADSEAEALELVQSAIYDALTELAESEQDTADSLSAAEFDDGAGECEQ